MNRPTSHWFRWSIAFAMTAFLVVSLALGWYVDHQIIATRLQRQNELNLELEREFSAYRSMEAAGVRLEVDSDQQVVGVTIGHATKNDAFQHLSAFPSIRTVDLHDCVNADDECIEHLTQLPNLKILVLPEARRLNQGLLTDRSLVHVSEIPSLQELYVDARHFTDRDFRKLAVAQSLRLLMVCRGELSPESQAMLTRHCPRLKIRTEWLLLYDPLRYLAEKKAEEKARQYLKDQEGLSHDHSWRTNEELHRQMIENSTLIRDSEDRD